MSLGRLPYEIIFLIVQDLGLEDIFHLSTTCKALSWILYEDRTCRSILEVSRNPLQKKKNNSPVFLSLCKENPSCKLMNDVELTWRS